MDRRIALSGRVGGDTGVVTGAYDEKCFNIAIQDIRSMMKADFVSAARGGLSAQDLQQARQKPSRLSDVAQANTMKPQPELSLETQKQRREEFQRRHPYLGAPTSMPTAAQPTDEELLQLQFSELKAMVKEAGLLAHLDIFKGKAGAIHLLRHGPGEPPALDAAPEVLVKETDSDEEVSATEDESLDSVACVTCGHETDEEDMLLCDQCDMAQHTFCCEPPLHAVPDGNWFCSKCSETKQMADQFLNSMPLPRPSAAAACGKEFAISSYPPAIQQSMLQASSTHAAAARAKPPAEIVDSVCAASTAAPANSALPLTHLRSGDTLSVDGLIKVANFAAAPGLVTQVTDVPLDQMQQLLQQLKSQGLFIAPSGVAGDSGAGVFAARDLRTTLDNPALIMYSGKVYTAAQWEAHVAARVMELSSGSRTEAPGFGSCPPTCTPYAMLLKGGACVDAEETYSSPARFVQHSEDPAIINCKMVEGAAADSNRLPALLLSEFIPAGTELFFDYLASTGSSPHLHAPRDSAPSSRARSNSGFNRFFKSRKRRQSSLANIPSGINLDDILPASARRRCTGPPHDGAAAPTAAAAQPSPPAAAERR
jgi:hypothetical protein